jgi:hypothetical protein
MVGGTTPPLSDSGEMFQSFWSSTSLAKTTGAAHCRFLAGFRAHRIRGPTNPVQLWDFCTHIHLHAACSPLWRSFARFGSQQVQACGGQRVAPYPPDAAWNCTMSESMALSNSRCADSAATRLRALSTATTLRRTASALVRSMLNRRMPNCRCRILYRCCRRVTSRLIETAVLSIARAGTAHGRLAAPAYREFDWLVSRAACKECCWFPRRVSFSSSMRNVRKGSSAEGFVLGAILLFSAANTSGRIATATTHPITTLEHFIAAAAQQVLAVRVAGGRTGTENDYQDSRY